MKKKRMMRKKKMEAEVNNDVESTIDSHESVESSEVEERVRKRNSKLINEEIHELILDSLGSGMFTSSKINGLLAAFIIVRQSEIDFNPLKVYANLHDYPAITLLDKVINTDEFILLKKQPQDGLGKFWTHDAVYLPINDEIDFYMYGKRGDSIKIVIRWLNK